MRLPTWPWIGKRDGHHVFLVSLPFPGCRTGVNRLRLSEKSVQVKLVRMRTVALIRYSLLCLDKSFIHVRLYSGGKDSCYNMMKCVAAGHEIVALANLEPSGRGIYISAYNCMRMCATTLTQRTNWTASCFRRWVMKVWL